MFFYNHDLNLRRINFSSICLLSKKKMPLSLFISLINCIMKIISKLLTERLSILMDDLIAPTQTAYIKGRYIMDNVVYAYEDLHTIHKKKIKSVLFKLDFEKTFDRVN
jgi:Reverse transcriptase (RNA-dependent DNA polymerase)